MFYVLSFVAGLVVVVILLTGLLLKYEADPKGINQEFVTNEAMPFPGSRSRWLPVRGLTGVIEELKLCRYLVGLSRSRLAEERVSWELARVLQWRLELMVGEQWKDPGMVALLRRTRAEYLQLRRRLQLPSFRHLVRHFLPRYRVVGHPLKAILYQDKSSKYTQTNLSENFLITFVEDLYLYNAICHKLAVPPDSVLALVIPFPPRDEYVLNLTRNYQLLPIVRTYLLMDENHDPIARLSPGNKYWGYYKLKSKPSIHSIITLIRPTYRSSLLMSSNSDVCVSRSNYHQQTCLQDCFGSAVQASKECRAVFWEVA